MLKLFALALLLATISAQENGADDILNDIASAADFNSDVSVKENERWGAPAPAPAPAVAPGEAPVPAHKGNWHALAKKGAGWWGKHAHASAPGFDGKNHGAGWWGKHAKNATGNAPAPAPAPGKGHRGRWAFLHGCPHCRCPKPGVFQRKVRWGMKPPSGKLRGSGSGGNGSSSYGGRRGSGSSGSRGSGSGSGGYGGRRGSGGSGPASSGSGFLGSGSGSGPASSGSGFFSSGSGSVEGGSGSGGSGSGSGAGGVLKKTKGGVAWTIPSEQNIQESDDADVEADLDMNNGQEGVGKRRRRMEKIVKVIGQ